MGGYVEQYPKQSTNEQSIENNMKQMGAECVVIYLVRTCQNLFYADRKSRVLNFTMIFTEELHCSNQLIKLALST